MKTKRFKMEDGSEQLFTLVNGKWINAVEHEKQKIAEGESGISAFLIGAGKKTADLVEGIDDLIGTDFYDGDNKDGYEELQDAHPVATTLGEIASEMGQIAAPGAGITKLAKLGKAGKSAPFIGDLLAATGLAGARDPGEGDRLGNMGSEALATIAGGAIGKMLPGASGYGVDPVAREMLDKGVKLTPEQAMDKGLPKFIASRAGPLMEYTPLLARAAKEARQTGERTWHKIALNDAALPGQTIKKFGHEGVEELHQQYVKAYKSAWDTVKDIPDAAFPMVSRRIRGHSKNLGTRDAEVLKKVQKDVARFAKFKNKGIGNPARHANALDRTIDNALDTARNAKRKDLADALADIKKVYRRNIPKDARKQLAEIDKKYPEYLAVKKAASKATDEGGAFTPNQLRNSSKVVAKESNTGRGKYPLRQTWKNARKTVAEPRPITDNLITSVMRVTGIVPEAGMRAAGNPLIGQNVIQRGMRKHLPEILRTPRLAAAINDESEDVSFDKLLEELGLSR